MATVFKRGDSYFIMVSGGYDTKGKQMRKTMTWKPDEGMTEKQIEKELERQKILFEDKVKAGYYVDGTVKFSEFSDRWMEDYAKKQLAPKTVERYRMLLIRINEAIGHIRLDRLQPHHLMEFYNNLSEKDVRRDVKYIAAVDFREYMEGRGFSGAALAAKAGVGTSTVTAACQKKRLRPESAKALCKALSARLSVLFDEISNGDGLCSKTILHHHRLISTILNTAVVWQVILSNPAERVKPPKVEEKEASYLDEEQAARLVELLQSEPMEYRAAITLLLYSGLRRGELLGLEWKDIDFEKRLLNVCRTSQYLPNKGIFTKTTKTKSSVRTLKLPHAALDLLREFRAWQAAERLKVGDRWEDNDRLFTQWNGKPMHPDSLTGWFKEFIQRTDLPQVHIHSLRHTNATLLIAGGTDVRTVSRRLGHAQTTTTMNIYSHAIRSADEAAAETLENLLDPLKKKG